MAEYLQEDLLDRGWVFRTFVVNRREKKGRKMAIFEDIEKGKKRRTV